MMISVIIRCRNEEKDIERCLKSIYAQETMLPFEVILVDSGSTDRTLDICSEFPLRIIRMTQDEFTFGSACNIGVQAAKGDLVAFISAHSYPEGPDWLSLLSAPFLQDSNVVASAGQDICLESLATPMAAWHKERYIQSIPVQRDLSIDEPFVSNSNAMYRRSYLQRHPFNEVVSGAEDVLWVVRTLQSHRDARIVFVPTAVCHHYHEPSIRESFYRMRIHGELHRLDNMPASLGIHSWLCVLLGLSWRYYEYLWRHRVDYSRIWFLKTGVYSLAGLVGYVVGRFATRTKGRQKKKRSTL